MCVCARARARVCVCVTDVFSGTGTAPAIWAPGDAWWREDWDQERIGSGCMGVYTNEAGGEVFTAGSTDWPHGEAERRLNTPNHSL